MPAAVIKINAMSQMLTAVLVLLPTTQPVPAAPGVYPRGVQLPSGKVMLCSGMDVYGKPAADAAASNIGMWPLQGTVHPPGRPGTDIGNCVLYYDNATSTLLASYRHHVGCKQPDNDTTTTTGIYIDTNSSTSFFVTREH